MNFFSYQLTRVTKYRCISYDCNTTLYIIYLYMLNNCNIVTKKKEGKSMSIISSQIISKHL